MRCAWLGPILAVALWGHARAASADALTPVEAWAPDLPAPTFRMAATCHDAERDVYGVIGVWRYSAWIFSFDAIRYLRVEGNSASASFGEVIEEIPLGVEFRVDNVDCATDGQNVFVAHDRIHNDAQWFRVDGSTVHGPYAVWNSGCDSFVGPAGNLKRLARPRIAFGGPPGAPRLIATAALWDWVADNGSSSSCAQQYHAYTGTPLAESRFWSDSSVAGDFDVAWNGDDAFVWAVPVDSDGVGAPSIDWLETIKLDLSGAEVARHSVEVFASPQPWTRTKLVFSPTHETFLWQTQSKTYWLDVDGAPLGDISNSVGARAVACEYRGASDRLANVFGEAFYWTGGGWPPSWTLHFATLRSWFDPTPGVAAASEFSVTGLYPEACGTSQTTANGEVLLINRPTSGYGPDIYLSMHSLD